MFTNEVFQTIIALILAFFTSIMVAPKMIPFLTKLKFGQQVRIDGPQSHLEKAGTPTMGGLIVLLSLVLGSIAFVWKNSQVMAILLVALAFGFIGFLDDYLMIVKKQSMGLKAYQKFGLQLIITALFVFYLYQQPNFLPRTFLPFSDNKYISLGIVHVPFLFFVMLGTVNGANFTDGLDGMATQVTLVIAVFFLWLSNKLGNNGLLPINGAFIGALLGFWLFNTHPAKVFMGDTGSLALGGFIAAYAIILQMEILIIFVGFIYIIEVVSVMLQVGYFKATSGKRLFKMAPIHHHFELSGWEETRITTLFTIITIFGGIIAFLAVYSLV